MQVKKQQLDSDMEQQRIENWKRSTTKLCTVTLLISLLCRVQISSVSQSCLTLCEPMDCSPPGSSLSMEFSRQEYWSGLPFPSPGDLPKPGIKPSSPVLSSFSFASFWSLPYWGLWELCTCATASTIPLHFIFSSVAQSCPTLCDPMNCSTPGLPIHHQLLEFTQTHLHRVRDAIQPSHPLPSPSPPAPNPSQHQSFPVSQLFT